MKKPKLSLDSAKMKSLFVRHVEKLLLVLVLVLVVWFVYRGYSLPGLEGNKTPEGLMKEATNTRSHIDNPNRWTQIAPKVMVKAEYSKDAEKSQLPTNPAAYHYANSINRPDFPKLSPRVDPKIFPPINLVVIPVIGPLAGFPEGTENDPLTLSLIEEEPKDVKKKVKKPKKTTQQPGSEMYAPQPSGYPSRTAKRRTRSKTGYPSEGDLLGGEQPGMETGSMMTDTSMSGPLSINPESILGFMGQEASTIQRSVRAMEVMAVVPFEKQIQEFENSLANSLDYDPQRDYPWYVMFWVERAESPGPEPDPASLTWKQFGVRAAQTLALTKWAGAPNEIMDTTYWDETLTHPAPPFMQRDLWDLLAHPDVPLAVLNPTGMVPGALPTGVAPDNEPMGDVPVMPSVGTGNGYNEGGGSGMPGPPGARTQYQPRTMQGGSGDMRSYGTMQPGRDSGSGYGYASSTQNLAPPKYKLIRFTDTTVSPGTYYQYRIRVLLHDPNHPVKGLVPPSLASLDEKVRTRIKEVDAADLKKGPDSRTYWVVSDPSESSKPTRLPDTRQFFVGGVTQPPSSVIVENKPRVPQSQPQSKALTVVWDDATVVDMPAEKDVYLGTLLNFHAEKVQVIHPVMRAIIEVPKYAFVTDAIVADMDGGDVLPPVDKKNDKPLKSPGELLVFDAEGNLHVQNETDDIEAYRRFTVPKPEEPKPDPNYPTGDSADGNLLDQSGYGRPVRPKRERGP